MNRPDAMLFDMDGVLLDSREVWFRVVEEAGRRFRGAPITREEFLPTFGQGTAADVGAFGLDCSVQELDRFYVDNFLRFADAMWVAPDAKPTLESLKARGLKLAVVTNTVSRLTHELLESAGIHALFDTIACADLVPRAKPAPDIVHHACRELEVGEAQAWMVGDSKYDRGAAEAAGVHFVGFKLDGHRRVERLRDIPDLLG